MANVASIQAVLNLNTGQFSTNITNAQGQVVNFNVTVNNANRSIQNMERRITGFGASLRDVMVTLGQFRGAMHTIWAFTGQWIAAIVQANAKLERLQQLMKGLSKSTTEAGKTADALRDMNYVLEQAKRAPFTVDAIGDAFVKLRASGIDPANGSLKALMDGIANFGGSSEQLHRATIAIQQMAGKGVVSMEELRQQLGEAIPNAMQLMARAAGMSMAELVKTVSTGRMAFDSVLQGKFFAEMNIAFQGASENMMNTWTGLTQRLKTEWLLFAQEVGKGGMFDTVKAAAEELIRIMSSDAGIGMARDMGKVLADAAEAAVTLVRWLVDNRDEIITWGKLLAGIFVINRITTFATGLVMATVRIAEMTAGIGSLTAGFAAARAGTATWSAAIGAAAGPIGIAITAIASLIFYLDSQYEASLRAADGIREYYKATSKGKAVLDQEHQAMQKKLQYLYRLSEAIKTVQKQQNAPKRYDPTSMRPQGAGLSSATLDSLLAEGRELGLITDGGNMLNDALTRGMSSKLEQLARTTASQIGEMQTNVTRQAIIKQGVANEEVIQGHIDTLEKSMRKAAPQLNAQLEELAKQLDGNKIGKAEYTKKRQGLMAGAMDAQIRSLEISKASLAKSLEGAKGNEQLTATITRMMDENDKKLIQVRDQRQAIMADGGITLLPKMGSGDEKEKVDGFLDLLNQLGAKEAALTAQLNGDIPKLAKFRELVERGEIKGNGGLKGSIEALYKSIDDLEKKVKTQKATDDLKQDLEDMAAKARADVISSNMKASGDLYSQVAAGMVGFNRQVEVMRNNLEKTSMSAEEFDAAVVKIKEDLAKVDMNSFKEYVRNSEWEAYLDSLPPRARALAEFNKELRENAALVKGMKDNDPNDANDGTYDALGQRADEAATQRYENQTQGATERMFKQWEDFSGNVDTLWANTMDGMADGLATMLTGGEFDFKAFVKAAIKELIKLAIQWAIVKAIKMATGYEEGGVHGPDGPVEYAKGGIHSSGGSVPLRKYARGGIAKSPQLALFGEGDMNEAYVPLPDGRTIPVTMESSGAGAGGTQVNNSVSIQVNVTQDGNATSDTKSNTKAGEELGKAIDMKVKQALGDEMRPGGILWKMSHGG